MSTTLRDIRSRGHWDIVIRPSSFQRDRIVDVAALEPLLESMQVRMSGWYFPHLDSEAPPRIKGDYIEQATEFEEILEFFRFYQSGQFVHLSGFREDWEERLQLFGKPDPGVKVGELMGIGSVLYRITQVYELAARMAQRIPGEDGLRVEIAAREIAGRRLVVDAPMRAPLRVVYRAEVPEFGDHDEFSRADFIAQPRELALDFITRLFRQFQWTTLDKGVLRGWQSQMFPTK